MPSAIDRLFAEFKFKSCSKRASPAICLVIFFSFFFEWAWLAEPLKVAIGRSFMLSESLEEDALWVFFGSRRKL